jgi:hypothetical protein
MSELTPTVVTSGPVIVHEGRYRLYQKPDGTMRIQYKRDDKDAEDFLEISGKLVALAEKMDKGMSPMDMMKEVTQLMMSGGI